MRDAIPYAERIEVGPWFTVGEPLDGEAVRERLIAIHARRSEPRPYAVYVHVPFCSSICSFCELYTHGVGTHADAILESYTERVLRSLELGPSVDLDGAPTTVHFGGGTPLLLGLRRFGRLVEGLTKAFGTSPTCEWAVETTTSLMDADTVDGLEEIGIRRIHLGIQTLDDRVRARIGRKETGASVIERIESLKARGLHVSVDLILGLEGVDRTVVEDDLKRLHDAGVRMFSVCELRGHGPEFETRRADPAWSRRHLGLWHAIWDFMTTVGLIPIHIGQFGRGQGDNLYFTHPARGEDCVAIGPYAHGSAGRLSYGNLLLPEYYQAIDAGVQPIAMGVDYRAAEAVVCDLERELLTHRVSSGVLRAAQEAYPGELDPLLGSWEENDLLRPTPDRRGWTLTASGSWFVGNMIGEARAIAEAANAARPLQG